VFENLRKRIASFIAPKRRGARMYHAAKQSRLTSGWGSGGNSSADAELVSSLQAMRSRSRALVRDAGYAKRGKVVVQNNVIGSGIGMQAAVSNTRSDLRKAVNDAIEEAWQEWCHKDNCHTGGGLHFQDLERLCVGEWFETGEIFVRLHFRAFGPMGVPLALEIVEPERLVDEMGQIPGPAAPGNMIRMGVEVDEFYRPVAYWIRQRHPSDFRLGVSHTDNVERVPADQIIHLRLVERWPQTRGEPVMHAVMRKLNDMDGYTEAEIIAARGAASYMGFMEMEGADNPIGEEQPDGRDEVGIEPGIIEKLPPGAKMNFVTPNRPNTGADPFMRMMLREVAAGIGASYESLSRDYSQSNYSASRLALLDDRDLWRVLQGWFIRNLRHEVHKRFIQQAALAGKIKGMRVEEYAVEPRKFEAVRYKPRGWGWIDPTKEVTAYKEAVKAGFTTVADVIAQTAGGQDLEDVLEQRRQELDLMDEADLSFDTSPENYIEKEPAPAPGGFGKPAPAEPAKPAEKPDDEEEEMQGKHFIEGMERVAAAIRDQKPPVIEVKVPETVVHVRAPEVHVQPPAVHVDFKAPDVHVAAPQVHVAAPQVTVAAPDVRVENKVEPTPVTVEVSAPEVHVAAPTVNAPVHVEMPAGDTVQDIERDAQGEITKVTTRRTA
jgi:lambda family phage portal protein